MLKTAHIEAAEAHYKVAEEYKKKTEEEKDLRLAKAVTVTFQDTEWLSIQRGVFTQLILKAATMSPNLLKLIAGTAWDAQKEDGYWKK